MNKLTRVLAGGLTSIIAVSAFAAPAMAVTPATVESSTCAIVGPQMVALDDVIGDALSLLGTQATALDTARDALDVSTGVLGSTGLDYIHALDGVGSKGVTQAAFIDAAVDFSEDVTTWIDAADAHAENLQSSGLNEVVLNYLSGLCA